MNVDEARALLGVTAHDSPEVIKKAYKKAALKTHPDKNTNDPDAKAKHDAVSKFGCAHVRVCFWKCFYLNHFLRVSLLLCASSCVSFPHLLKLLCVCVNQTKASLALENDLGWHSHTHATHERAYNSKIIYPTWVRFPLENYETRKYARARRTKRSRYKGRVWAWTTSRAQICRFQRIAEAHKRARGVRLGGRVDTYPLTTTFEESCVCLALSAPLASRFPPAGARYHRAFLQGASRTRTTSPRRLARLRRPRARSHCGAPQTAGKARRRPRGCGRPKRLATMLFVFRWRVLQEGLGARLFASGRESDARGRALSSAVRRRG